MISTLGISTVAQVLAEANQTGTALLVYTFPAAASEASWHLPHPAPPPVSIESPKDRPFPGTILLQVDTTDVARRVYQRQEVIPVQGGHPLTLRFPQWTTGDHAPTVPLEGLAGLVIVANGRRVGWARDSSDIHSFHITVPVGARALVVRYQYLAPGDASIGSVTVTPVRRGRRSLLKAALGGAC
jgi:hypothetical protein